MHSGRSYWWLIIEYSVEPGSEASRKITGVEIKPLTALFYWVVLFVGINKIKWLIGTDTEALY